MKVQGVRTMTEAEGELGGRAQEALPLGWYLDEA